MLRSNFHLIQTPLLKMVRNRSEVPYRDSQNLEKVNLFVIRNEPFEPYLQIGVNCASALGVDLEITFSHYEDNFSLATVPTSSDFVVIWLNWERLSEDAIKLLIDNNPLLKTWACDERFYFVLPSKFTSSLNLQIRRSLDMLGWSQSRFIEYPKLDEVPPINFKFSYSRNELDGISSLIGMRFASLAQAVRIRAIIIDLDNTLYEGVYGEDFASELKPTNLHLELQQKLKQLSAQGVLLCVCSKNNSSDVQQIFDSILVSRVFKEDFTLIEAGWGSKADSINRILNLLNFDERYVAFIDDSSRELMEVGKSFPNMLCVNGSNPSEVLEVLEQMVTFENSSDVEAIKSRKLDIQANLIRSFATLKTSNNDELLVKFKTKIKVLRVLDEESLNRANELFRKTNQFNLTLARSSLTLAKMEERKIQCLVATLADEISNSGKIAALSYSAQGNIVNLSEFVISCRALGRGVEKYIFRSMLSAILSDVSDCKIRTMRILGDKNSPAIQFLDDYFIDGGSYWSLNREKLIQETQKWYDVMYES